MASSAPSLLADPHPEFNHIVAPRPVILPFPNKSVFLAGSIDMGKATEWQTSLANSLSHLPVTILNPRRPDWSNDWVQDISCAPFLEQVTWELDMLEAVDVIALYFSPESVAPISLMELGLFARTGKVVVACPEGFWRRGNVQVVCERFGMKVLGSIDELVIEVSSKLQSMGLDYEKAVETKQTEKTA